MRRMVAPTPLPTVLLPTPLLHLPAGVWARVGQPERGEESKGGCGTRFGQQKCLAEVRAQGWAKGWTRVWAVACAEVWAAAKIVAAAARADWQVTAKGNVVAPAFPTFVAGLAR